MHEKLTTSRRTILLVVAMLTLGLMLVTSPTAASAATKAKVNKTGTKLYKSTKNTKSFIKLKKGTIVTVVGQHGKWVKAKVKGKTGYIRRANLTKIKSKSTLRARKEALKAKANNKKKKKTSMRTLRAGNRGAAVKKVQSRLVGKGYLRSSSANGKYGAGTARAIKQFQILNGLPVNGVASIPTQKRLFSSSARGKANVSVASWGSSGIDSAFPNRSTAVIVDMRTGTRINIRRLYGSNHCDVEPRTLSDTKKLKRIYGGQWSWDSRGVLLIAGGRCFAAAINSMPHGSEISRSNGYPGQFCLHLTGSKTHGTDRVNAAHQANIKKVYNYFK